MWVINASPLIILGRVSALHVLEMFGEEILIPRGVAEEVLQPERADAAAAWILQEGNKYVHDVAAIDYSVASWDLGKGETQVLSYVHMNPECTAVIDDKPARRCAASMHLKYMGTVGVLLLAKELGYIDSFADYAYRLVENGFRLDQTIINKLIKYMNE